MSTADPEPSSSSSNCHLKSKKTGNKSKSELVGSDEVGLQECHGARAKILTYMKQFSVSISLVKDTDGRASSPFLVERMGVTENRREDDLSFLCFHLNTMDNLGGRNQDAGTQYQVQRALGDVYLLHTILTRSYLYMSVPPLPKFKLHRYAFYD